jgi:hypothetical protein
LVSLKEFGSDASVTCQPVTASGQLFDMVKNRRKRNVDGEVLANRSGACSGEVEQTSMGARF